MVFFSLLTRAYQQHQEFKKYLGCTYVGKSKRYQRGIASYGKAVKSAKRKTRIIAELNAMGVKPRLRRKAGRRIIRTKKWRVA